MGQRRASALNYLRIRHIRLMENLVASGSLHKAAATLHMSQPTASAMLREVEEAVGTRLFERTRQGVTLNAHGNVAMARLRPVLSELGRLDEELRAREKIARLRVGTLQAAFFGVLQAFLPAFLARTRCTIDLVDGSASDLVNRLKRNELDCLIGRMPVAWIESLDPTSVFYQPLYEARTCIVAGATHPLARRRKLTLADVAPHPWILPREGSNARYVLLAALAAAGLPPPHIAIETSSFVFTLPLLAASGCLTVAPRDASLNQQRLGLARMLPLKLPQLLSPVAFVARRSSMENPNLQILWEEIRRGVRPEA
jgi:DNA-binding transcriptional LysR family regulator